MLENNDALYVIIFTVLIPHFSVFYKLLLGTIVFWLLFRPIMSNDRSYNERKWQKILLL